MTRATRQKLQVVSEPDAIERLIADRLAEKVDQMIDEVDWAKVTALAAAKIGKNLKARAIDWLSEDSPALPCNEIEAQAEVCEQGEAA